MGVESKPKAHNHSLEGITHVDSFRIQRWLLLLQHTESWIQQISFKPMLCQESCFALENLLDLWKQAHVHPCRHEEKHILLMVLWWVREVTTRRLPWTLTHLSIMLQGELRVIMKSRSARKSVSTFPYTMFRFHALSISWPLRDLNHE